MFSPDFTGDVTIRSDGSKIEIDDGSTSVVSRCFEGRWPNVSTIIDKADDASSSATIDSVELASCATIASAVSLAMRIEFSGMSAKVSASGERRRAYGRPGFCEVDGEFSVCVNAKYLIDCLSNLTGTFESGSLATEAPCSSLMAESSRRSCPSGRADEVRFNFQRGRGGERGVGCSAGSRWRGEIEPFPCAVLAKRFPEVPNLGDVSKVDWKGFVNESGRPDVLVEEAPASLSPVAGSARDLMELLASCGVRPRGS